MQPRFVIRRQQTGRKKYRWFVYDLQPYGRKQKTKKPLRFKTFDVATNYVLGLKNER